MRILLLPLVILLAACDQAPPPSAPLRPVATIEVGAAATASTAYSGEVRSRVETPVAFRVGGRIAARHVNAGSVVKAGDALMTLDAASVEDEARAARAQLAAADAQWLQARDDAARYRLLRDQQFVSEAALNARENTLKSASGARQAAQAQLALANRQVNDAALRAETDGVVAEILAEAGQVVASGQPVLRLARPGAPEVAFAVPENHLIALRQRGSDTAAAITLWAGTRTYRGHLRELAAVADTRTRTYAARVAFDDADDGVQLGMTAEVRFTAARDESLIVPLTAIFQQQGSPAVWQVEKASGDRGKVRLQPVKVSHWGQDSAVISEGLKAGDLIVAAGAHMLTPGEEIRLLAAQP